MPGDLEGLAKVQEVVLFVEEENERRKDEEGGGGSKGEMQRELKRFECISKNK